MTFCLFDFVSVFVTVGMLVWRCSVVSSPFVCVVHSSLLCSVLAFVLWVAHIDLAVKGPVSKCRIGGVGG